MTLKDNWNRNKKSITVLAILIAVLSVTACLVGLLASGGSGEYEFQSIRGELIRIYGEGLYQFDSVSVVAQGKASDLVTLVLAVPVLLLSLVFSLRGSIRGRLMLTGTLGYFLYTYVSYTFLWNYNRLFLVYVFLMSASFFAFAFSFTSFAAEELPDRFSKRLPVKALAAFQFAIGFFILLLWLGKIAPSILNGQIPLGLEHYTTLVIQGMDLGIIVPAAFLSGFLLLKRSGLGYLLTAVLITKSVSMLTCITAMIINQLLDGISVSPVEYILFPLFNLIAVFCLFILLVNVRKEKTPE